jgi:hypothetical protein
MPGTDLTRMALRSVALVAAAIATSALPSALVRSDAPRGGPDVAIVLDVSMSMLAADVAPDRLTVARRAVIDLLRNTMPARAAVVVFAGDARVICPLTPDLDAVRDAVNGAAPVEAAAGGSDVTTAIERAGELFQPRSSHAQIVVVTDGEPGPGDERQPEPLARALAARGIALAVIGVGTIQGAAVPLRDGGIAPRPRVSRLDRRRLIALADEAGGRYLELGAAAAGAGTGGGAGAGSDTASSIPGLTHGASEAEPAAVAISVWTGPGLLVLVAIGALLLDTALWWLRRTTNPWG